MNILIKEFSYLEKKIEFKKRYDDVDYVEYEFQFKKGFVPYRVIFLITNNGEKGFFYSIKRLIKEIEIDKCPIEVQTFIKETEKKYIHNQRIRKFLK